MPIHIQLYPDDGVRDDKAGSVLWVNQLIRTEIGQLSGSLLALCLERNFSTLLLSHDELGHIMPVSAHRADKVLNEDARGVLRAYDGDIQPQRGVLSTVLVGEVHDGPARAARGIPRP
jgi:hypothetical protein